MNGIALLNVHREICLDVNAVIDRFAILHPQARRKHFWIGGANSQKAKVQH